VFSMVPVTIRISCKTKMAKDLYCDLVRINGVGAVAAKSFLDAGYKSISDIANTNSDEMLVGVSAVNDIKHYYKAKLDTKDMQFCIDFARIIMNIENAIE